MLYSIMQSTQLPWSKRSFGAVISYHIIIMVPMVNAIITRLMQSTCYLVRLQNCYHQTRFIGSAQKCFTPDPTEQLTAHPRFTARFEGAVAGKKKKEQKEGNRGKEGTGVEEGR